MMRELIHLVVKNFYKLAIDDVLIGYHFKKFQDPEVLDKHLDRLTTFWELQLTGESEHSIDKPFHLLFTHLQLRIHPGELGRWIILFHQTLDALEVQYEHPNINRLTGAWKNRIALFEERFKSHPQMFKHD